MPLKCFFVFLLCAQPLAAQQKLTLTLALEKAFQASPTYLTAKNQYEVSELETKNANASFFPSLDLTTGHGVQGTDPDRRNTASKTSAVSGATLSLTENFYDNGESAKKYRIAKYRNELSKINFQKVRAQLIRSVLLAYYRYNISVQRLKFTQKSHEELERFSKLLSNQFYQGMKTKKDFLNFKTRAQRGRLDVIAADAAVTSSRSDFVSAIGLDADEKVQLDETIMPLTPKKSMSKNIELDNLYEFKTLQLQRSIGEVEVDLAKRKFWPEFNLVGAASYGSSNYIDTNQTWSDNATSAWSVLLNIKFNLIDWGVRSRNIQIAAAAQNTNEQSARSTLLQAQKDLESFKLEVDQNEENYRLAKELQKMEEDTFKMLERDYRSGQTTYLELITGLANLLDAQARGLDADYKRADLYLRWKYYKGLLNEETIFE